MQANKGGQEIENLSLLKKNPYYLSLVHHSVVIFTLFL